MKTKRTVCLALVAVLILCIAQITVFASSFTDVPEYSYYADAVDWAVANNITTGTSQTSFSPNNALTRIQMVTFLWRMAGTPGGYSTYANGYTDLTPSQYQMVGWALYYGITNGTAPFQFSPHTNVKNKDTLTFMYRAVNCNQLTATSTGAGCLDNLNLNTSSYAYIACTWANNQGYLNSIPDFNNGFLPNSTTTRAIAVYLLWEMATGNYSSLVECFVQKAESHIGDGYTCCTNTLEPWCSDFVCWCAQQVGLNSIANGQIYPYSGNVLSYMCSINKGYIDSAYSNYYTGNSMSNYEPERGDIFCLSYKGAALTGGHSDHIVIVKSYNIITKKLVTIEGNCEGSGDGPAFWASSKVKSYTREYTVTANSNYLKRTDGSIVGYIIGFGHP